MLSASGLSDAETFAPQFDTAADDVGLLYTALEVWTIGQDKNSANLANTFAGNVASDLMKLGPQAMTAQSDLKGITVPGQIVIAGDGVPGSWSTFGSTVDVNYTFTNVGDKGLPAGSVMLVPNANVSLLHHVLLSPI